MLAYWLLGLAPVAAVGYVVWRYRNKSAVNAVARERRLAQLLAQTGEQTPAATMSPGTKRMRIEDALAPALAAAGGPAALPYEAKAHLLTPPCALLYYLLKSALPEYEVFAQVNLAAVIEVAARITGAERDERRRAISQLVLDCVVCKKGQGAAAAIDLAPGGASDSSFKSECLKAAGVRYLRFDPLRLPRRQNLRALVLGQGEGEA